MPTRKTEADYNAAAAASPHSIAWAGGQVPASTKTPTAWRCLDCGHEWLARYNNIVCRQSACPACSYGRRRKPPKPRQRRTRAEAQAATDKRCAACGQVKPLDAFHVARAEADGRVSQCKACRHVPRQHKPLSPLYRCSACRQVKPRAAFYPSKASRNGHGGQCRECNRARAVVRYNDGRARAMLPKSAGRCSPSALQARVDFYGGLCWVCGLPADQVDHVIPLALGGTNWPANLRPACARCNRAKWAGAPGGIVVTRVSCDPARLP